MIYVYTYIMFAIRKDKKRMTMDASPKRILQILGVEKRI